MDGKWERHGDKHVYENEWMTVDLVDVELPDGTRIEHHAMKPRTNKATCVLCYDSEKGVLLIWRHRFINDQWGWELPAGGVDEFEPPIKGAAREMLEETGWQPGKLQELVTYTPMSGVVETQFHCFYADSAEWVGPGRDINEAADVAWVSLDQLRTFIGKGEIVDGMSLTALLFALQLGPLKDK